MCSDMPDPALFEVATSQLIDVDEIIKNNPDVFPEIDPSQFLDVDEIIKNNPDLFPEIDPSQFALDLPFDSE